MNSENFKVFIDLFFKKTLTNTELWGSYISARGAEKEPRRGDLSPDRGGRSRAAASAIVGDDKV